MSCPNDSFPIQPPPRKSTVSYSFGAGGADTTTFWKSKMHLFPLYSGKVLLRFNLRSPVQFTGHTPAPVIRFASLLGNIDGGA